MVMCILRSGAMAFWMNSSKRALNTLSSQMESSSEAYIPEAAELKALDEVPAKIATMIMEGYSITEIARHFGVSKAKLIKMSGIKEY